MKRFLSLLALALVAAVASHLLSGTLAAHLGTAAVAGRSDEKGNVDVGLKLLSTAGLSREAKSIADAKFRMVADEVVKPQIPASARDIAALTDPVQKDTTCKDQQVVNSRFAKAARLELQSLNKGAQ